MTGDALENRKAKEEPVVIMGRVSRGTWEQV